MPSAAPARLAGLALVLLAALLPACSRHVYLNDAARAELRGAPAIHVVHYAAPLPEVHPPKAHVAPYTNVKLHATPTGAEIQSNLGGYDPTLEVAQRFASTLAARAGLRNLKMERETAPLPVVKDPRSFQDRFKNGLVMEVWVEHWNFSFVPVDWKTYAVTLSARARLSRAGDGQVLWNTGDCAYGGSGKSYEDRIVLADLQGSEKRRVQAKIRQTVARIAEECARQLMQDYSLNK